MCGKGAVQGCCISVRRHNKMYEICKGIKKDKTIIWTAVAWTDTGVYADMVLNALSDAHDGKFAILCNRNVMRIS